MPQAGQHVRTPAQAQADRATPGCRGRVLQDRSRSRARAACRRKQISTPTPPSHAVVSNKNRQLQVMWCRLRLLRRATTAKSFGRVMCLCPGRSPRPRRRIHPRVIPKWPQKHGRQLGELRGGRSTDIILLCSIVLGNVTLSFRVSGCCNRLIAQLSFE